MSGLLNRAGVLNELDELIQLAEAQQDYCEETGANEAMKRAMVLTHIRTFVANAPSEEWARMRQWALDEQEAAVMYLRRAQHAETDRQSIENLLTEVSCWRGWKYAPKALRKKVYSAAINASPDAEVINAASKAQP